jgi:hypothetical protein
MSFWRKSILGALLALLLGPIGCALSLGGGKDEKVYRETVGQELIDLKQAKDKGALSDEEYQKARKRLIDSTLAAQKVE